MNSCIDEILAAEGRGEDIKIKEEEHYTSD